MKLKPAFMATTLTLSACLFAMNCGEQASLAPPTGPTLSGTPAQDNPSTTPTANPTVVPTNPEVRECDIVKVDRAHVKVETDCEKGARWYVPATITLGTGYYNIWLPAINAGKKHGPFEYNTWSRWVSLSPGEHSYALAAETITDEGKVYQCDWHKRSLTVPECACAKPPLPVCEFGPPVYNWRDCSYTCPPCVMPPAPECRYGPPEIDGCGWKCPPCVLPDPPKCQFGPPIPDEVACTWSCPPCTLQCKPPKVLNEQLCICECPPPGDPECPEQTYNSETCQWEGDCYECDMGDLNEGCYSGNVGNAQHFYNRFGICMRMTHKTNGQNKACTPARWKADAVVVKGGPQFRLYTNVKKGQQLCTYCPPGGVSSADCKKPDISHIVYLKCDENATCR